jgi:hypothetical protein
MSCPGSFSRVHAWTAHKARMRMYADTKVLHVRDGPFVSPGEASGGPRFVTANREIPLG